MLALQLERVARARLDGVVVATSDEAADDAVAALAEREGFACFRGSLDDVLDRFYRAAAAARPEHVVRLTADCPLIDPSVIDRVAAAHLAGGHDYTSNTLRRTFAHGEDTEVMRFAALERAWREATSAYEREHVTPYLYRHPELFDLGSVEADEDHSQLRWTVDYPEDLAFVRAVYEALYPVGSGFSTADVVELLARRPELTAINAAVGERGEGGRATR
jgi:spore coat polysaccharide biosynthesis protein SpsF